MIINKNYGDHLSKKEQTNDGPYVAFNKGSGAGNYTSTDQLVIMTATPTVYYHTNASGPAPISGTKFLNIKFRVINGVIQPSLAGDDLTLAGNITSRGYSGTLLIGRIISGQFTFYEGAYTNSLTLKFAPMGGSLVNTVGYLDQDIAINMSVGFVTIPINWGANFIINSMSGSIFPRSSIN